MKKLALFSALFALIVTLFFVACKKDEPNSLPCMNPDNPFDYFGAKHNEGLNILAQYSTGKSMDMGRAFQTLEEHGFDKVDYKSHSLDFALILSATEPIKTIANKLKSENKITENLYSALLNLNDRVMKYGLTPELTGKVKEFEKGVATLGLDEKETQALLMSTSVARFSNEHWQTKYGQKPTSATADRAPISRANYVIACDVAAAAGTILGTGGIGTLGAAEAAVVASEFGGFLWDWCYGSIAPPRDYGWGWGGGIMGYPCNPGWSCPCTIDIDPLGNNDPFYMTGSGFMYGADVVVMAMDGSALDPAFFDDISDGTFDQSNDFTVPQDVVDHIYASGNFPAPVEPTVFPQGPKQVFLQPGTDCIIFPVAYPNGDTTRWHLVITH